MGGASTLYLVVFVEPCVESPGGGECSVCTSAFIIQQLLIFE